MKKKRTNRTGAPTSKRSPKDPVRKEESAGKFALIDCETISSERYQAFVESISEGVYELDLKGNFQYFNNALCKIFGYPREEMQSQPFAKFVDEEYAKKGFETFRRIYRTGESVSDLLWKIDDKEGNQRIIELSAHLITDKQGKGIGFRGIARDITDKFKIQEDLKESEKRLRTLLRISMELPEYPDLDELLDFIGDEIRELLGTEVALVVLLDEENNEIFFKSAAHEDLQTEIKMKEVRFPADKGVSGKVIRTGEAVIVPDASKDPDIYKGVDAQTGFRTKNILGVPLRTKDRNIGVLMALNKKTGMFDAKDVELLNIIEGTVALSIDNARVSQELKQAYKEVKSLNKAKGKVINHLSHELKTPVSVLSASLNILEKKLSSLPPEAWKSTVERVKRNLERILEMQYEVEDIMRGEHFDTKYLLTRLLDECADELEVLIAEEVGEGPVIGKVREKIDRLFGPKDSPIEEIRLNHFVSETFEEIRPLFSHRKVEVMTRFESVPKIRISPDVLKKVVVGLIRNAVENTPDESKIEISVKEKGKEAELTVRDYGVGITPGNQRRIFEGFLMTQDTMDYSSKRPFDFNAGGKGSDLLRMKIFSERYNFRIQMTSTRCWYIPQEKDLCPGIVRKCGFCNRIEDCYQSGGTTFTVLFPILSESKRSEGT